jgi:F-type H+-transporting ATPase subunit delta
MTFTLRGASREALGGTREHLASLTRDPSVDLAVLGDELFAVLGLLETQPTLRRTLSDPSRDADAKAGLVRSVLGGKVSAGTLILTEAVARARWSGAGDMVDSVERLAVEATVAAAEREGRLDDVEDELFRFVRILDATPALRQALSDGGAPSASKDALLASLLGDRTAPATQRLVRQAATAPRGRSLDVVLRDYGQVAADRRSRLVARVRVAAPLLETQRTRLASALQRLYGREIHLDVDVDPRVLGGVEVSVAGEIVDGTVLNRLQDARRRLAG